MIGRFHQLKNKLISLKIVTLCSNSIEQHNIKAAKQVSPHRKYFTACVSKSANKLKIVSLSSASKSTSSFSSFLFIYFFSFLCRSLEGSRREEGECSSHFPLFALVYTYMHLHLYKIE